MRLSLLLALYWDSGGARQRWRRLGPRQNDGRDGVLEDELLLVGGFKHDRVFVKASDAARQLRAAGQVNRDQGPFLARGVQKPVLNILLLFHVISLLAATRLGLFQLRTEPLNNLPLNVRVIAKSGEPGDAGLAAKPGH